MNEKLNSGKKIAAILAFTATLRDNSRFYHAAQASPVNTEQKLAVLAGVGGYLCKLKLIFDSKLQHLPDWRPQTGIYADFAARL